jgi:O-methyltransferase
LAHPDFDGDPGNLAMTLMEQAYYRGMLNYLKVFYGASGKEYVLMMQNIYLAAANFECALSGAPNKSTSPRMAQADTYLHLLKRTLTRYPLELSERLMFLSLRDLDPALTLQIAQWVMTGQAGINRGFRYNPILRALGLDWPAEGETMIGLYRLDNIEHCIVNVLQRNVPGDLAETGVWRGGASIFMRAVLKAYGDLSRKVWLADSFHGFPKPDEESYPADRGDALWAFPQLAVPLETVKTNFARYGLLDEQVHFLPGWFRDTLPTAPIDRLAVLRLDGGMYESTIVALQALYRKVSPGGFVIVDDYNYVPACRQAVEDFRTAEGIIEPLCPIDWTGVYWQAKALPKAETNR